MMDRNIHYKLVDEAIMDKVFPGCVIGLIKKVDNKFESEILSFGKFGISIDRLLNSIL